MWKRYAAIAVDVAIGFVAYYFLGWIGFALWTLFVLLHIATQVAGNHRVIMETLLSRLPNRCALCHREILDEGGVFDEDGIYHAVCSDKLAGLEDLRREAGVPYSEAIHIPRKRRPASQ
jgi:hypothetical protein